jgi:hypothetical protein
MQIKLFTIPVSDTGTFSEELNRFLRSHKILEKYGKKIVELLGANTVEQTMF